MYGGHVTVLANSPHLRKSGSKNVVSDLGTSDLGNSSEENFLHLVESNEMKGVTTPLTSATIMPSPILLWRLKFLPHFLVGEVQFESPEFAGSKYEDIHLLYFAAIDFLLALAEALQAHLVPAATGIVASFGIDQIEITRIQKIPDCLEKKISVVVYTSSQIVLCLTA